jgi:uncharacterized protein with PIN domain
MATASFRFYEELNDFLPPARRKVEFVHPLPRGTTIKDVIEALGVPHTEVDLILVNGLSVDFSYSVRDGDHISVFPVFEAFDIGPLVRVRPQPLRVSRFIANVHLGKLARYLRLLGFDTLYRNDYCDADIARLASEEKRILLTRDRGLLKHRIVTHGYCVRATQPRQQLREVLMRLDLHRAVHPFQRCMSCNGLLAPVDKAAVLERLQPSTRRYFHRFWNCTGCARIYWQGSHYLRLQQLIRELGD